MVLTNSPVVKIETRSLSLPVLTPCCPRTVPLQIRALPHCWVLVQYEKWHAGSSAGQPRWGCSSRPWITR